MPTVSHLSHHDSFLKGIAIGGYTNGKRQSLRFPEWNRLCDLRVGGVFVMEFGN